MKRTEEQINQTNSSVLFRIQLSINELESYRKKGFNDPSLTNALVSLREAANLLKWKGVKAPEAKISR